jgi:hypothetical protein
MSVALPSLDLCLADCISSMTASLHSVLYCNTQYHTGVKYGNMIKSPAIKLAWDLFAMSMMNNDEGSIEKLAEALLQSQSWQLLRWFQDPTMRDKEVRPFFVRFSIRYYCCG